MFADRLQIEHGVEGRDLEHPHIGHVQEIRDVLDGGLGQPVIVLLLRLPEERQHCRGLPAEPEYFAICASTQPWLACVKAKVGGWRLSAARRRTDII